MHQALFNLQHWRPVIVEDAELRQKFARLLGTNHSNRVIASPFTVLCAKVNTWEVDAKRVWDGVSSKVSSVLYMLVQSTGIARDRPQTQRDEVMRSAGIFAQTLMLLALKSMA